MAVEPQRVTVPRLPRSLRDLGNYLLRRDTGAPSTAPVPGPRVTVAAADFVTGWELDTLTWEYNPAPPDVDRVIDGFVLWWQFPNLALSTTQQQAQLVNPAQGGVRVSAASRAYSMAWPEGLPRAYAVAAFRNTWQGERTTGKQQHPTWVVS